MKFASNYYVRINLCCHSGQLCCHNVIPNSDEESKIGCNDLKYTHIVLMTAIKSEQVTVDSDLIMLAFL